jgi:hypothetical protein
MLICLSAYKIQDNWSPNYGQINTFIIMVSYVVSRPQQFHHQLNTTRAPSDVGLLQYASVLSKVTQVNISLDTNTLLCTV